MEFVNGDRMRIVNKTGNPEDTKILRDNGDEIPDDILSYIGKITITICGGEINTAIIEFSNVKLDMDIEDENVQKVEI